LGEKKRTNRETYCDKRAREERENNTGERIKGKKRESKMCERE
jgi:hypothetical protein